MGRGGPRRQPDQVRQRRGELQRRGEGLRREPRAHLQPRQDPEEAPGYQRRRAARPRDRSGRQAVRRHQQGQRLRRRPGVDGRLGAPGQQPELQLKRRGFRQLRPWAVVPGHLLHQHQPGGEPVDQYRAAGDRAPGRERRRLSRPAREHSGRQDVGGAEPHRAHQSLEDLQPPPGRSGRHRIRARRQHPRPAAVALGALEDHGVRRRGGAR